MTLEERLDRWEQRQEAMIATMSQMIDILLIMQRQQAELVAWLKQPPGTELSDLIRELILANNAQTAAIERNTQVVASLQTIILNRPV
jgi:hypothetical protein